MSEIQKPSKKSKNAIEKPAKKEKKERSPAQILQFERMLKAKADKKLLKKSSEDVKDDVQITEKKSSGKKTKPKEGPFTESEKEDIVHSEDVNSEESESETETIIVKKKKKKTKVVYETDSDESEEEPKPKPKPKSKAKVKKPRKYTTRKKKEDNTQFDSTRYYMYNGRVYEKMVKEFIN